MKNEYNLNIQVWYSVDFGLVIQCYIQRYNERKRTCQEEADSFDARVCDRFVGYIDLHPIDCKE